MIEWKLLSSGNGNGFNLIIKDTKILKNKMSQRVMEALHTVYLYDEVHVTSNPDIYWPHIVETKGK